MEMVYDLLKITIPAVLVLYSSYLWMRSTLQKQLEEYRLTIRHKNQEIVLPVRLQAYERICLLLERINPNSMVPKLSHGEMTGKELQSVLINEIRNEYNHNLSQQVYMSEGAWMYVSGAVEKLISTINEAGMELDEEAASLELARKLFQKSAESQEDTLQEALRVVKREIKELF